MNTAHTDQKIRITNPTAATTSFLDIAIYPKASVRPHELKTINSLNSKIHKSDII